MPKKSCIMQIWAEPGKIGPAHSQLFTNLISVFNVYTKLETVSIVDDNNGYYVPNTCLLQDIRTLGAPTNQILAILSKPASKEYSLYSTIEYQAKGISVDSIRSLKAFRSLISL